MIVESQMFCFFQYNFEEVDITAKGNSEWFGKYRYEIPVFHLNGEYLMKHKADVPLLLQRLKQLGIDVKEV